jgi:hypothetical protein
LNDDARLLELVGELLPGGLSTPGWPMASVRHVTITREGKVVR